MSLSTPEKVLFRDEHLDMLSSFINSDPELMPSNMIVEGCGGTGKTCTLKVFFNQNPEIFNVWLQPIEHVSWKPLMQAICRAIHNGLKMKYPEVSAVNHDYLLADRPYQLVKLLETILSEYSSHTEPSSLVVVLDGLDSLQDLDAEILLRLMRMHELLPLELNFKLKLIFVIKDPAIVNRYASLSMPKIVFQRYTFEEIMHILNMVQAPQLITSPCFTERLQSQNIEKLDHSQLLRVATNFIQLMMQSFHSYTGNDIIAMSEMIDFKWEQFVNTITADNVNEPLKLYKSASKVFQSTDDSLSTEDNTDSFTETNTILTQTYELTNISKHLLIAGYICSYLDARYDASIFSRRKNVRSGRSSYGRRKAYETNPRNMAPSLFPLERMLAVFQAIYPVDSSDEVGSIASLCDTNLMRANVEVFQNISELHSLKLLAVATGKNVDFLCQRQKWKINASWEVVNETAKSVNFELGQYFVNI